MLTILAVRWCNTQLFVDICTFLLLYMWYVYTNKGSTHATKRSRTAWDREQGENEKWKQLHTEHVYVEQPQTSHLATSMHVKVYTRTRSTYIDPPSSPPVCMGVKCFFCCCLLHVHVALWRTPHERCYSPPHLPQHSRDKEAETSVNLYTFYYYISLHSNTSS